MKIFKPGELIRDNGFAAPGECYLVLSHVNGESRPYKGSQGRREPGCYRAISPAGLIVVIPDDPRVWKKVA